MIEIVKVDGTIEYIFGTKFCIKCKHVDIQKGIKTDTKGNVEIDTSWWACQNKKMWSIKFNYQTGVKEFRYRYNNCEDINHDGNCIGFEEK